MSACRRSTRSATTNMITRKVIVDPTIKDLYITGETISAAKDTVSKITEELSYSVQIIYHNTSTIENFLCSYVLKKQESTIPFESLSNISERTDVNCIFHQIDTIVIASKDRLMYLKGINIIIKAHSLCDQNGFAMINQKKFAKDEIHDLLECIYKVIVFSQVDENISEKRSNAGQSKTRRKCNNKTLNVIKNNSKQLYNTYAYFLFKLADKVGRSLKEASAYRPLFDEIQKNFLDRFGIKKLNRFVEIMTSARIEHNAKEAELQRKIDARNRAMNSQPIVTIPGAAQAVAAQAVAAQAVAAQAVAAQAVAQAQAVAAQTQAEAAATQAQQNKTESEQIKKNLIEQEICSAIAELEIEIEWRQTESVPVTYVSWAKFMVDQLYTKHKDERLQSVLVKYQQVLKSKVPTTVRRTSEYPPQQIPEKNKDHIIVHTLLTFCELVEQNRIPISEDTLQLIKYIAGYHTISDINITNLYYKAFYDLVVTKTDLTAFNSELLEKINTTATDVISIMNCDKEDIYNNLRYDLFSERASYIKQYQTEIVAKFSRITGMTTDLLKQVETNIESESTSTTYELNRLASLCTDFSAMHVAGGASKITILGKYRKIYTVKGHQYIKVKGEMLLLSKAIKLEKKLAKEKATKAKKAPKPSKATRG